LYGEFGEVEARLLVEQNSSVVVVKGQGGNAQRRRIEAGVDAAGLQPLPAQQVFAMGGVQTVEAADAEIARDAPLPVAAGFPSFPCPQFLVYLPSRKKHSISLIQEVLSLDNNLTRGIRHSSFYSLGRNL